MWLLEFIFGMFLAYLILSPRLRNLIFHRDHTPDIQKIIETEEKREKGKTIKLTINGQEATVDENEITKWFSDHPKLNKTSEGRD